MVHTVMIFVGCAVLISLKAAHHTGPLVCALEDLAPPNAKLLGFNSNRMRMFTLLLAWLAGLHLASQVAVLDGEPVAAKEKVLAANMHGADADGLRAIRRKYFPNGASSTHAM